MPTTSSDQTPRTHVPGGGEGAAIHDTRALVLAWIAGGVIGVAGIAVAAFGKIMENVE